MKTFGELTEDDVIFRYEKGGDEIKARRILKITESEATVLIKYANNRFARLLKEESTCDKDFFLFFSCKNAVEEFLLQMERDERERHWNEEKKIQKLREQYESERS